MSVSVLIPCYNGEGFVIEAVRSALEQTYKDIEVIVIDDGSTDQSALLVRQMCHPQLKLIEQRNAGASAARNNGLKAASGNWCVFLDADDYFDSKFLASQVSAIKNGDADICFGWNVMTWPDGRKMVRHPLRSISPSVDHVLSRVLSDGWYPPNAILWRTSFVRQLEGWDESITRNDDGDLIARALLRRPVLASSDESYAVYRQHSGAARISRRSDSVAVESSFRVAARVFSHISNNTEFRQSRQALSAHLFELAFEAYYLGYEDVGKKAEMLVRMLGPRRRTGSTRKKIACALLGTKNVARLSRLKAF